MIKSLYERMGHSVYLESEKSTDVGKVRQNSDLQMSLFDWLGTCRGTRAYFINPGFISLRISTSSGHLDHSCRPMCLGNITNWVTHLWVECLSPNTSAWIISFTIVIIIRPSFPPISFLYDLGKNPRLGVIVEVFWPREKNKSSHVFLHWIWFICKC